MARAATSSNREHNDFGSEAYLDDIGYALICFDRTCRGPISTAVVEEKGPIVKFSKRGRLAAIAATCGLAVSTAVGMTAGVGNAATVANGATVVQEATLYRQLVGEVQRSMYFETSVPTSGAYVIEYELQGVAYFNTYLNGVELGYVGGVTGVYQTRPQQLSAGGHLLKVTGPHGSGTAKVYIVQFP